MPSSHIVIESEIVSSFRVEQVRGMFDVPNKDKVTHEWDVKIPCEERPWRIGLIVGPSGAGKTTIGKRLFPEARFHEGYDWPADKSLVDGFPKTLDGKSITQSLSSVGFSSPPHWLKRYSHLSNGQKFRAELARLMLEDDDTVIFDEFTSVVDRDVAKVSCAAVAKALRARSKPNLIALSCHYDIIDWLNPDWIYDVAKAEFQWRLLRRHPEIRLEIHKTDSRAWPLFRGHHYLTGEINNSAQIFVALYDGTPVALTSFIHFPHSTAKNIKREHRTVVLPDFQGVGIGNRISEWLGSYVRSIGFQFNSTTSHPAMIRHRLKSPLWNKLRLGHAGGNITKSTIGHEKTASSGRLTASFQYVGPKLERKKTQEDTHGR